MFIVLRLSSENMTIPTPLKWSNSFSLWEKARMRGSKNNAVFHSHPLTPTLSLREREFMGQQ